METSCPICTKRFADEVFEETMKRAYQVLEKAHTKALKAWKAWDKAYDKDGDDWVEAWTKGDKARDKIQEGVWNVYKKTESAAKSVRDKALSRCDQTGVPPRP